MYTSFFGLSCAPFSIAPNPEFLFRSPQHREALAHLLYGMRSGGMVVLTGEIGTGKTTLCRQFLAQLPADCRVAYVFNPRLSEIELLQTVCDEFHLPRPALAPGQTSTVKDWVDPLNAFLLQAHAAGETCVLVIDEAQNLSLPVLEQLRLLTNLETTTRKLLRIVLIGQPELRQMLARPELEQLAQRVTEQYHLGPLNAEQTQQYIAHRLQVAGWRGALPFDRAALGRIHRLSGGVPRRINLLCDRALLGAFVQEQRQVGRRIVAQAGRETLAFATPPWRLSSRLRAAAGWALLALAGLGLGLALGLVLGLQGWHAATQQAAPPAAPPRPLQPAAEADGLPLRLSAVLTPEPTPPRSVPHAAASTLAR